MSTAAGLSHAVVTATLSDLMEQKSNLRRTASHFHWGQYLGIDEDGRFRVQTVEGRKLWFDVRNGKLIRAASGAVAP